MRQLGRLCPVSRALPGGPAGPSGSRWRVVDPEPVLISLNLPGLTVFILVHVPGLSTARGVVIGRPIDWQPRAGDPGKSETVAA